MLLYERIMTVGEFMELLSLYKGDKVIIFAGGELKFQRLKTRGHELVNVEFDQTFHRVDGKLIITEYRDDS